ncbi:MAG TPA: phenylalanine--tRNA ligase subunit beta [Gemmatimonadaceae bacterium]|nr:phenylalanine--tRNA ligase subunit beta [Gemmatimonadaceae bacterium]
MNASYRWLKSLVPLDLTPNELRDLLTSRTVTVDEIVSLREDLSEVVVGLVVEAGRHPNSDHLWLTKVDAGAGELLEVVCGAPNVQAGRKYPFAPSGATLPGGLKLERRKIRGIVSNGMLCSARELALGEDSAGILELDTDAAPGTPLLAAKPVGDTRIVLDVNPNRPDLLSHLGIAREIAAITGQPLLLPGVVPGGAPPASDAAVARSASVPSRALPRLLEAPAGRVRMELRDTEGCPHYSGVALRGVKVGPSPSWLVERLAAVGSRSINNVVDITNYMLHEVGQPMHAFDLAKLNGPGVIIRRAQPGERLRTLDGVDRTLDESMTVIADATRAQAIAGVMGGADSEVTEQTTDVLLEVATFDRASVRRTRRALGLSTDASYRFERGTDWSAAPAWVSRAVELIRSVAGGTIEGEPVHLSAGTLVPPGEVKLRPSRVAHLLGVPVPREEIRTLLESIGFSLRDATSDELIVQAPSWRWDITREIDLIEEVARLRGYDTFPDELRPFRPSAVPDSALERLSGSMRDSLVALGLLEARPLPFVRGEVDGTHVRVCNPIAENEGYLRRSLLETLVPRAEYNLARRQRDIRLFEIGSVFAPAPGGRGLPREEVRVGALIMGHRRPPHWSEPNTPDFDEWDAKGMAERMLRTLGEHTAELRGGSEDVLWHIVVGDTDRGQVRRVSLDAPVWAPRAFGVELTIARMESADVAPAGTNNYAWGSAHADDVRGPRIAAFKPLPTTPPVELDLALLVPPNIDAARVEQSMRAAAGDLLESLALFDEYRGAGVPAGYRSLAWRLTFRHAERTLRDKEIAARREKLLRTLEGELGVRQRSS